MPPAGKGALAVVGGFLSWLTTHMGNRTMHTRLSRKGLGSGDEGMGVFWVLTMCLDDVFRLVNNALAAVQGKTITMAETIAVYEKLCDGLEGRYGVFDCDPSAEPPALFDSCHPTMPDEACVCAAGRMTWLSTVELQAVLCHRKVPTLHLALSKESAVLALHVLGRFVCTLTAKVRHVISERLEDATNPKFPDVRALTIIDIPVAVFTALLDAHTQRLLASRSPGEVEAFLDKLFTERRGRCLSVEAQPSLKEEIVDAEAAGSLAASWRPVYTIFPALVICCDGLGTVMSTTATVVSDFSIVKYVKDSSKYSLHNYSLQG
jgi:hypothetical protein